MLKFKAFTYRASFEISFPICNIASESRSERDIFSTPAINVSHLFIGINILFALLLPIAAAMLGVTSPISASAITIPTGPTIISALRLATAAAFSPVAAVTDPP